VAHYWHPSTVRIRSSVILAFLVLTACGKQAVTVPDVAPEEVLRRSAQASRNLRSAQYVLSGTFESDGDQKSVEGDVRIDGSLADAGKQVRFRTDFTSRFAGQSDGTSAIDGSVEIVVMGDQEVYVNLGSLQLQPENNIISPAILSKFAGRWWRLPSDAQEPVLTDVTPDPSLLRAQSEVVRVVNVRGPDRISGRPAYHYDVTIDRAKFSAFLQEMAKTRGKSADYAQSVEDLNTLQTAGEMWIDAETFNLLKTSWNIQHLPLTAGSDRTYTARFTVELRNHNAAPDILPPEAAADFDPSLLLAPGLTDAQSDLMIFDQNTLSVPR